MKKYYDMVGLLDESHFTSIGCKTSENTLLKFLEYNFKNNKNDIIYLASSSNKLPIDNIIYLNNREELFETISNFTDKIVIFLNDSSIGINDSIAFELKRCLYNNRCKVIYIDKAYRGINGDNYILGGIMINHISDNSFFLMDDILTCEKSRHLNVNDFGSIDVKKIIRQLNIEKILKE